MSQTPKSIVYLRPDTIGDLLLFSAALAQLRAAWPEARHTVVVRQPYLAVGALMPEGIHWLGTSVNPFRQDARECGTDLDATLAEIAALQPDLIVAATLTRTWLEAAVAGHFSAVRSVALGAQEVEERFATGLRLSRQIDAASAFSEKIAIADGERDWAHSQRLVDHLLQRPAPSPAPFPTARLTADEHARALALLPSLGVQPKSWVAVFPGGVANVTIKTWPAASFAALVVGLRQRGLTPVLLGHVAEESALAEVNAALSAQGAPAAPTWLGRDGELGLLGALFATSRLYVGHDTGAMHLAAAVGTPTLGIFGGGHWPRFRPIGHQVGSAVQPLPCFNCGWACHFSTALCVKTLPTATVLEGVDRLLAAGAAPVDFTVEGRGLDAVSLNIIGQVTPLILGLQADRVSRQATIEDLKRETNTKDEEIAALKISAEERKQEMESIKAELEAECDTKDAEIGQLKSETNTKDVEIEALKRSAEERKQEMESIKAELEAECDEKDAEIAQLKQEADNKDREISELKGVCNERESLIIIQDQHIKRFQGILVEHEAAFAARDEKLTTFEAHFATLPADASQWAQALQDKDVHIRNQGALLYQKDLEILALRGQVANFENGLHNLEASKFYGRLLADKEAVLQTLHQACVEREKVIQQLALQNVGMGRIQKFWFSAREHIRLRYSVPFSNWLFRKVVEEYEMQIGVLRHHEPRPIRWDAFPKSLLKTAPDTLPRIGIVTPSYGQAAFIETTLLSVLNQAYPKLHYVVQDGGSKDASPTIIARYADRLHHWESVRDRGQADAVRKGFVHLEGQLGPEDIMAWLNSDDFLAPRALSLVAAYFARHPEVDVVYGHRILVDGEDREIGRWIMPPHDPATLEWIDYVPQETLFWRKRVWDQVGGIDPSFQFALDWDLLARFQKAGARMVRLPYALGCFRVHAEQKTSQQIHTVGNEEMIRVRRQFHGDNHTQPDKIQHFARKARFAGALSARLLKLGLRSTRY